MKHAKSKVPAIFPLLGLDNDTLYTHDEIARKLRKHFGKTNIKAIRVALHEHGKKANMGSAKQAYTGWQWKCLARKYFPDWEMEQAKRDAELRARQEQDAPKEEKHDEQEQEPQNKATHELKRVEPPDDQAKSENQDRPSERSKPTLLIHTLILLVEIVATCWIYWPVSIDHGEFYQIRDRKQPTGVYSKWISGSAALGEHSAFISSQR